MFLSFRKNKETKCISVQISKKFKRPAVSLSKMCRLKIFVTYQNFLRTLEIHYKIFGNSHLKFGKREKAKIKKQHVRRPVLTSVGFLKCVALQLFPKYSQSYVNLNVKKESKIQLPLKSRWVAQRFLFECNLQNSIRAFKNGLAEIHDVCSFEDIRKSRFHAKLI